MDRSTFLPLQHTATLISSVDWGLAYDPAPYRNRPEVMTTKTLRRRFFSIAGRLTRSARRLTLHLPQRWHWEDQFSRALARFRALPLPD